MADNNVTVLGERLERWTTAYVDPVSCFTMKVSSYGRLMIASNSGLHVLTMTSTSCMMQGIMKELMAHGFGHMTDGPPDQDPVAFLKGK